MLKRADTFIPVIDYDDILTVLNGETTPVYDADGQVTGNERYNRTKEREQDAENYGDSCSKVLITYVSGSTTSSTATPTAKFIVIYE